MDEKLIEKVAIAICDADGQAWRSGTYSKAEGQDFRVAEVSADPLNDHYRHKARAAIQALKDAGWKGPEEILQMFSDVKIEVTCEGGGGP